MLTRSMNLHLDNGSQQKETAAQADLNKIRDRLEKIRDTELRIYFSFRDELQADLESLSDDIFEVASNNLCSSKLFEIADRQAGCEVDFDLRNH